MKLDVKTFGGAVSHLEMVFQTLDFPNKKEQITKYVKNNQGDTETCIAWDTYSKVMRNIAKYENKKRNYIWTAEDKKTGKKITAKSGAGIGFRIGTNKFRVVYYQRSGTLLDNRYKITRVRA